MENKRLYRNSDSKFIAGVCSGLGEYFDLDPVFVRIIFVVLAMVGGGGVLAYFILWIVVPRKPFDPYAVPNYGNPQQGMAGDPYNTQFDPSQPSDIQPVKPPYSKGSLMAGLLLVTLGTLFLLDRLIPGINFGDLWPVLLIVVGLVILAGSYTKKNKENEL